MSRPLSFQWDGEAFKPVTGHRKLADAQFVIGERYTLETVEERSSAQHRFYFASVNDAWCNLPETMADKFPTADHLRKYALIHCGYRDERTIACASRAEALRVSAFVRPMDEFAIVTTSGPLVTVWTAKSQRVRAMGKEAFKKSCDDVLHFVSQLIGARPEDLGRAA